MILQLRIQALSLIDVDDGKLLQVSMVDTSAIRTDATFVTYLSPQARAELQDGDLTDTFVTGAISGMAPGRGGSIKLRGNFVSGKISEKDMVSRFAKTTDFTTSPEAKPK